MKAIYDTLGVGYSAQRRPDPRIARMLRAAMDGCRTVANIGAGAGSYEPEDLNVVAVEPSLTMIRQRRQTAATAVQARAEALPFGDASFDAVMGVLTLHHWTDVTAGLAECARLARRKVVFLTVDAEVSAEFWLVQDYFPDILQSDRKSMPSLDVLRMVLGPLDVTPVQIPADCIDGFLAAYWRRPEAYLDPAVRAAISAFSKVTGVAARIEALRHDLTTGRWEQRHRDLLSEASIDVGYRIVTARFR